MDIDMVGCSNGAYKPKVVSLREVEGVQFLQVVIEMPGDVNKQRAFYFWRPTKDDFWMPMPIMEFDRVLALSFSQHVGPCENDEEQTKRLDDMILTIEGDVV